MTMFFWVSAPCRLIGRCQSFGETYCLHLQGWSGNAGKWRDLYKVKGRERWGVNQGRGMRAPKPRTRSPTSPPWKPQISEFLVRFVTKWATVAERWCCHGGSMVITTQNFGPCIHTALLNFFIQCWPSLPAFIKCVCVCVCACVCVCVCVCVWLQRLASFRTKHFIKIHELNLHSGIRLSQLSRHVKNIESL
jgi:hypothetical protein